MYAKNSELNKFLKRSKWFSKIFSSYRGFAKILDFVNYRLIPEQKEFLGFEYKGKTIDFKTQLLIYFEDRYSAGIEKKQIREIVRKAISKYQFLFKSGLDKNKIRSILLRIIMDLISVESQCFFYRKNNVGLWKDSDLESKSSKTIAKVKNEILKRYPNLPLRENYIRWKRYEFSFARELFINRYEAVFESAEEEDLWVKEFFKKTKWFFEKLNTCEPEYRNKYRERIFQETNFFIGEDKNATHSFSGNIQWIYQPKVKGVLIESNTNKYIEEVVEEILNSLGTDISSELQEANSWDFKDQLLQRYYSRYSSFVSLDEMKEYIKQKCLEYKSLIAGENKQLVKEIFMDELDQELFVSKNTHVWNQEMLKNLSESPLNKISSSVRWAIDQIIRFLNPEESKTLNVTIEDKEYDLQALLTARWKRSVLAQGKKAFLRKLLEIKIQTPYFFLNSDGEVSSINLQIFLEKIDACFLYPRKGRNLKILLRKDDTGALLKTRKNLAYLINEISRFRLVVYRNHIFWLVIIISAGLTSGLTGNFLSFFFVFLFLLICFLIFY